MDILYLLVPMSVLVMLAVLAVFAWALHAGQFDELEAEGARVLDGEHAGVDEDQGRAEVPRQESPGTDPDLRRNPA